MLFQKKKENGRETQGGWKHDQLAWRAISD